MGHPNAISDLTPAGGWTIWGYNTSTKAQVLNAVCTGNVTACDHIYQGGAVGTLVRMPEGVSPNAGHIYPAADIFEHVQYGMPFARIVQEWMHDDQTVPAHVQSLLAKRDTPPVVRGLRLDTNFSAVDPSQYVTTLFEEILRLIVVLEMAT